MLFDKNRHESLTSTSWDKDTAQSEILSMRYKAH